MSKLINFFSRGDLAKKIIVLISVILFISFLTQVAYITDYNDASARTTEAIMTLLLGWIGIVYSGAGICWLANPLLLFALIKLNSNPKTSMICSFFALICSFSFLLFGKIAANEGGGEANIISRGAGYWLWLSSCLVMCIGTIILYNRRPKTSQK